MLKNLENMQPIPNRMQKVNGLSAAPDCDTLVNSAVIVYPIHVDQCFSTPVLRAAFGSQAPFVRPSAVFQ